MDSVEDDSVSDPENPSLLEVFMDNNILSALAAINVAELTRADWIAVGMALKEEGFPC